MVVSDLVIKLAHCDMPRSTGTEWNQITSDAAPAALADYERFFQAGDYFSAFYAAALGTTLITRLGMTTCPQAPALTGENGLALTQPELLDYAGQLNTFFAELKTEYEPKIQRTERAKITVAQGHSQLLLLTADIAKQNNMVVDPLFGLHNRLVYVSTKIANLNTQPLNLTLCFALQYLMQQRPETNPSVATKGLHLTNGMNRISRNDFQVPALRYHHFFKEHGSPSHAKIKQLTKLKKRQVHGR